MISKKLTVENRAGIHTRPASLIVKTASKYKSHITFKKDDVEVNGKSIMGIITLAATHGTKLTCVCEGEDERELLEAITALFENRFEDCYV